MGTDLMKDVQDLYRSKYKILLRYVQQDICGA